MANYSKQIYDKAWASIAARKDRSRQIAAARRSEVRARLPQIAAIEREMAAQAASVAKLVIADPERAGERIEALAEANLALQRRRAELLAGAGYPTDYLSDYHECAACRDTGLLGAKMCECLTGLLRREAGAALGRTAPIKECTFDTFSLEYYDDAPDESGVSLRQRMRGKLGFCKNWAAGFTGASESMLLAGPAGVGKTHLSLAMAGAVSAGGHSVVYTPVQRMMDFLEGEKFSRDSQAREKFLGATDTYLECDLLILDDLGTEFITKLTISALYELINTRLINNRKTIVSSNLSVNELRDRYTEQIASRLDGEYQVLTFRGEDIRMKKNTI